MHEVDQATDQMVRSVLAYAENRLRMNPVPLDRASVPTDKLYDRLSGIITEAGRPPTRCSVSTHRSSRRA